jgi:phage tail sheath protein FI
MEFYNKCKCGHLKYWKSSTPLPGCTCCPRCGSGVSVSAGVYPKVLQHEFVSTDFTTTRGPVTLTICRYCQRTRSETRGRS